MENSNCCDANMTNDICMKCREHCISIGEEMENDRVEGVKKILEKYLEPKPEYDGMTLQEITQMIIKITR